MDALELKKLANVYQRPIAEFTGDADVMEGSALPKSVQRLARAALKLTENDRAELLRFAEFLGAKRRRKRVR